MENNSYTKTQGVQDLGKEYEKAMCVLYALKLVEDDNIIDFKMTANNAKYGLFDDIEIDVTFKNRERRIFLFQLKYHEKEAITRDMLTKPKIKGEKNKLYLHKYFKAISNSNLRDEDVVYILYTNRILKIGDVQKLSVENYELEIVENNVINNKELLLNTQSQDNTILKFKPGVNTNSSENNWLENPCEQFYIFSEQFDLTTVEKAITAKLNALMLCEISGFFRQFMKNWWIDNIVLKKHDVIGKLTELALSPYIRTISARNHNEKTKKIKEEIMKFELTVVEDCQEETIRNIWTKLEEHQEWKVPLLLKYEIMEAGLSEAQKSKILWHLGKVPLIVKIDQLNENVVKRALSLLRKHNRINKIILLGSVTVEDFRDWDILEYLSDLKKKNENTNSFKKFLSNFLISLQGRCNVSLERLFTIDEHFTEVIRITDLLKMSQESVQVGKTRQKKLIPFYMPRQVFIDAANAEEILELRRQRKDNVIIICNMQSKDIFQSQNVNLVEHSGYLKTKNIYQNRNTIMVSTEKKFTYTEFSKICENYKKSNVYVFRQLKEDSYYKLFVKCDKIPPLKEKIKETYINETQILNYLDNGLSVFCALPGMGKSTLMKVLNNKCPFEAWAIYIELINYHSFLAENPNFETIKSRFMETDNEQEALARQIKNILCKNKKVYLFLDGLDEVDSKYVDNVINFVKRVSSDGIKVWIASRENLRTKIKENFLIEPIEIREVDEEQQKNYIRHKLGNKYSSDQIDNIVTAVYASSDVNKSQELLGIPLQLYIITEMFLTNEDAYKKLQQQNVFVLTEMYKLFFQGKAKTRLMKVGAETCKSQLAVNDKDNLKKYEFPALKSCLNHSDYEKLQLNEKNVKKFLKTTKEEGDKYGIIKTVDEELSVVFNHQTYAEYFACKYFKRKKDKIKLLGDSIFSERYDNLRCIFNMMLAKNNPLHLAIIYKNLKQFNKNIGDLKEIDKYGRTALHLACSYGRRYPKKFFRHLDRETTLYLEIIKQLTQDVNIHKKDTLFDYDYVKYATASRCLYPVEKLLEKNDNFKHIYSVIMESYDVEDIACYAAYFGYPNLYKLIEDDLLQHHTKEFREFLLHLAIERFETPIHRNITDANRWESFQSHMKTIKLLINHVDVNARNDKGFTPLHTLILGFDDYDVIKLLLEAGANPNLKDSRTRGNALHLHCRSEEASIKTVSLLLDHNVDVNAQNLFGETAFMIACETSCFDIVQLLLKKGAKPSILKNTESTGLHCACGSSKPNIELINLLLKANLNPNARDIYGKTPLMIACTESHFDVVKLLLESGSDPNMKKSAKRGNALHLHCQSKKANVKIVSLLVDHGVDVNAANKFKETAFQFACETGHFDIAQLLLKKGANPNASTNIEGTALHHACASKKPETELIRILLKANLNPNVWDSYGRTPLLIACTTRHFDVVKLLLESGSDPNLTESKTKGNTLHLHCRSAEANVKIVGLLLDYIDVNAQNAFGETAFQIACGAGHFDIVQLLLQKGVDPNILNKKKKTALHYACALNKPDIELIRLLLEANLDPNAGDREGKTPFLIACTNSHFDVIKLLLEAGADPNLKDSRTKGNALHLHCQSKKANIKIVCLLMGHIVDVNAQNVFGETAFQIACRTGHLDIVQLLLEKGANPNIVMYGKTTALHCACGSSKPKILLIKLLLRANLDPNARDDNGRTPYQIARIQNHYDAVNSLLEAGADPNLEIESPNQRKKENVLDFTVDQKQTSI